MKQYLLFFGDDFYPNGGWADFHSSYHTEDDAFQVAQELLGPPSEHGKRWYHVIDSEHWETAICHRNDGRKPNGS